MAITKILARNGGLKQAIEYVLNGDKTQEQVLTAHLNCDPGFEYRQMMDTKRELGKLDGRQCYHIIQSFVPGEITPELALQIASEFASEYLVGYQVVIGTHTDRHHIHSHILFNSVNDATGEKYHCSKSEYFQQIRAVSDRLCREHGLSVIMIDTSGSMSDERVAAAYSEVKGAIDQFDGKLKGWLGFFDAAIIEPAPFADEDDLRLIRPVGGGGTDFQIIFEYVQQHMQDSLPACIIILTNGFAPFPNEELAMDIPVLWLLNNEDVNPPWGRIAKITV